jgi:hypothetical protein
MEARSPRRTSSNSDDQGLSNRDTRAVARVLYLLDSGSLSYQQLVDPSRWNGRRGRALRARVKRGVTLLEDAGAIVAHSGRLSLAEAQVRPAFLYLRVSKHVAMSRDMNRSSSITKEALVLKDGVDELPLAIIIQNEGGTHTPHVRLHRRTSRLDRDGRRVLSAKVDLERTHLKQDRWQLGARFYPPLAVGEVVRCGFSTWAPHHFARTPAEAVSRFGFERIREGFYFLDPARLFTFHLSLPVGYVAGDLRVEVTADIESVLRSGFKGWKPVTAGGLVQSHGDIEGAFPFSVTMPRKGLAYFVTWSPSKSPKS